MLDFLHQMILNATVLRHKMQQITTADAML